MIWLARAQRLQFIAQAGLTYSRDPYDRERFEQIQAMAAEILAEGAGAPPSEVLSMLQLEKGYATPKVDIRVAVFEGGRVLLVREASDGRWSLPGGWADVGDTPSAVAVREAKEESGYDVRVTKLLAVLDKSTHDPSPGLWYTYKIFFRGELTGGAPLTGHETEEVGWFGRDELPALSIARNTPGQLARLFEHFDAPDLPADFD
ncbi:MAG TPA: NUDIX hydrolase [Polyangiaceae bacterium]|jgi:ADP-ribose pyrophosphatase YjhB (NUDIX family)|nr:NUDIX hydrolase [Polyangiaceae bacterium]